MSKETKMSKDQIDETAGADSLKPQSQSASDPKSKVETLKAMVGAANSMTNTELTKWFTQMIDLYPAVGQKPVGKSADSNRATTNMKAGGTPLAPMPQVKIKEDMDALFEGESLTEEAKDKITTLFEAAVQVRSDIVIAEAIEALEEQYETKLTEQVEEFIAETDETISQYLKYSVDRWLEENELAVVNTLRVEHAEEFMDKMADLLRESRIEIPEDSVDVLDEMVQTVEQLEDKLSKTIAENARLAAQIEEATMLDVVSEQSEGLTMVDAERLSTLVESVEFTSKDEYAKKVKVIKEKYFPEAPKTKNDGVETLNEENLAPTDQLVYQDPLIEQAVRAMNNMR